MWKQDHESFEIWTRKIVVLWMAITSLRTAEHIFFRRWEGCQLFQICLRLKIRKDSGCITKISMWMRIHKEGLYIGQRFFYPLSSSQQILIKVTLRRSPIQFPCYHMDEQAILTFIRSSYQEIGSREKRCKRKRRR